MFCRWLFHLEEYSNRKSYFPSIYFSKSYALREANVGKNCFFFFSRKKNCFCIYIHAWSVSRDIMGEWHPSSQYMRLMVQMVNVVLVHRYKRPPKKSKTKKGIVWEVGVLTCVMYISHGKIKKPLINIEMLGFDECI